MTYFRATFLTILFLTAASMQAVNAAETYKTSLNGTDKRPNSQVVFHGSCGDECFAASLDCDDNGDISFTFADIDAKIAAQALTSKTRSFAFKVGTETFSFSVMKLNYGGEMYGTWMVEGLLESSKIVDFRNTLAKAKNFIARIGSESLMLPVSTDVRTWAKACIQQ